MADHAGLAGAGAGDDGDGAGHRHDRLALGIVQALEDPLDISHEGASTCLPYADDSPGDGAIALSG